MKNYLVALITALVFSGCLQAKTEECSINCVKVERVGNTVIVSAYDENGDKFKEQATTIQGQIISEDTLDATMMNASGSVNVYQNNGPEPVRSSTVLSSQTYQLADGSTVFIITIGYYSGGALEAIKVVETTMPPIDRRADERPQ